MKNSYWLPSGTYNIALTKDELNELLENGCIIMKLDEEDVGKDDCGVNYVQYLHIIVKE